MVDPLPTEIRDAAATLARKERAAESEDRRERLATRREELVAAHGYRSRIREDDPGATLICYPDDWVSAETVDPTAIDDRSDAIEIHLEGPGDPDDWTALADRNRAVAAAVEERHGPVHGANARAFAAFMSNHRAREIATATPADIEEFRTEYYVRNVWPSGAERAALEESIALAREIATRAGDDQR